MNARCTRRDFLGKMGMGAAAVTLSNCAGFSKKSAGPAARPNVLVLFTDDQRFSAVNALFNPAVHTPNMDRLARNGTAFTNTHIMGSMSGAVCMPSRAMLMSGRNLFHLDGMGQKIPDEHVTLPELLRGQGYNTFGTGKWHNGPAAYARSFSAGANIFFGGMSDHLKVPVHDFDPDGKYPKEKRYIADGFSSVIFSDSAIRFLDGYEGDAPFFMYVSYTAPHDPRMAPKEYADLYPPKEIELPPNFMPLHPFDNGEMKIRDENLAPFPRTPENTREQIAAYYAMVTHADAQIGRVLKALEESGKADDTIIIFAADNGLAVGQHGLMGKQNLYEHSVRVPMVFSGPGIPQGKTCDALCYLHDIYPTICDLTGAAIPDTVESESVEPFIRGRKREIRETLYGAYKDIQRMVCDRRWKLILYNVDGVRTTQLFDLETDPWEMNDLSKDRRHAAHVRRLHGELLRWMRDIGDERGKGLFT